MNNAACIILDLDYSRGSEQVLLFNQLGHQCMADPEILEQGD